MVLGIIPKEKWENTSPRLPSHWLKLWKTREGAHAAVVIQHLSRSSFDHCVTATNGKEFQHLSGKSLKLPASHFPVKSDKLVKLPVLATELLQVSQTPCYLLFDFSSLDLYESNSQNKTLHNSQDDHLDTGDPLGRLQVLHAATGCSKRLLKILMINRSTYQHHHEWMLPSQHLLNFPGLVSSPLHVVPWMLVECTSSRKPLTARRCKSPSWMGDSSQLPVTSKYCTQIKSLKKPIDVTENV